MARIRLPRPAGWEKVGDAWEATVGCRRAVIRPVKMSDRGTRYYLSLDGVEQCVTKSVNEAMRAARGA